MKLTDIFIKRPVLAICINLIVLIAGYKAFVTLPTRQYPKSDLSVVNVKTTYIGANAELVKGFVTTPLERAIASADGIDYITSSSSQGFSEIKANLVLNYPVNSALTQIQAKVAEVRNDLPAESELPVIEVESADNKFASMYLSFYSDSLKGNQITDYLVRVVQPKLSSVLGVQKAEVLGERKFAIRVWLKPDVMFNKNISSTEVREALLKNNYLSATGSTKGALDVVTLSTNTDLRSAEEFENLIVRGKKEEVIRLRDIATIELGAENYDSDVRFAGKQATFMGIWVLPDSNSLEVIRAVRKLLPEISKILPIGLSVDVPYDGTAYIEDALSEVFSTLIETILIVIVVIYLFMGSFRSVLVPVVAIPLSLIGTGIILSALGFTINLLTLLAIVLAVGLVVDDAIVMVENVERLVSEGNTPFDAAIKGARELFGPLIAMTITLAAVYAPIGFQGGLTGALFKEFAFTLSGAVFISGFVALTLSPMMSSRLLKAETKKNKLQLIIQSVTEKTEAKYKKALLFVLSNRVTMISGSILFSLILVPLFLFSTQELAPREDQGVVFGIVLAPPNASLEQTTFSTKKVFEAFSSVPEYKSAFQITNPTSGFSGMLAKPWSERSRTTQEIEPELWMKTGQIPGVQIIVTTPPPLPGGGTFPVEMTVMSTDDPEKLLTLSQDLVQTAFASGKFMFADSDLKFDLPEYEIIFNRDKISALNLDLRSVGNELEGYLSGNYTNRFSLSGRSYKVIPQIERSARLNPEQILSLGISTTGESGTNKTMIPLSAIAEAKPKVKPRALNKFQQLNSFTIQGANVPGTSVDEALTVLENRAKEVMPFGYQIDYPGESRQLRKEGNSLTATLVMSFVFIFLVLASQFESFRDPLIILFGSVPLALSGALIFPFLGFTTLNIYSQVGLITLVGLVAKNGILIVEFANHIRDKGMSTHEAIIEGAATRLRPVLMTSVATVVGHFPLILASGAGAAARNSIGIVLVSGMIIGTILTLFVVPAIYSVIAKDTYGKKKQDLGIDHAIIPTTANVRSIR